MTLPAERPGPELAGATVYDVDDAPGDNDRDRIRHALAAVHGLSGRSILRFSPREYLVEPDALDSYEPVLGGAGFTNLTIEGRGATLVALNALDCEKGYFWKISRFENLVVRDLTLTHRPLPLVQGTIVHTDQIHNQTTVALQPGFDHLDRLYETPHAKLWCRAGLPENPLRPKPGSPSWMDVGVDGNGRAAAVVGDGGQVTLRVGAFSLDATLNGEFNWHPGDPIVLWKRGAQDGLCFEDGRGLLLQNVRVESALHYAIKLRGVMQATLRDCHVTPAAGAMLSSSADGIDVQQSRDVTIEHCTLVATGDDAISFLNHAHGVNGMLFEEKFPPPFPETNHGVLIRDNVMDGGNRNGILLLASNAEVLRNTIRHTRQYGIKFTGDNTRIEGNRFVQVGTFAAYQHVEDELDTGIICSDEWLQSNVSIRGNEIEDWSNMPGILLKSVRQARVEHNLFVVRDPARMASKPFNPYLASNHAICVTHGFFGRTLLACTEVLIRGNEIRSKGPWTSAEEAVFVHGEHASVVIEETRLVPIETAPEALY